MSKRKFNQLSNLGHLFPAASNVVVSNFVQVSFLVLTVERLALAMDDGVLSDDSEVWGIQFHNLELHLSHATSYREKVAHPYRTVGLQEVGLQVNIEERTG